jgi:guanidinopropionase
MDNELCVERITEFYRHIDTAGAKPVSFGGDHSITGAILQAIAGEGSGICEGRKVAIVHFDAIPMPMRRCPIG